MKTRRPALALLAFALLAVAGLAACEPTPPVDGATPGETAVAAARAQLGKPYVSGGESPAEGGFDCSGLTYYAWGKVGVVLPRTTTGLYSYSTKVAKADLKAGDFVFYSSAGPKGTVSHVALYSGEGTVIQARKPGVKLSEDKLATFWTDHLVGYGRVPAAKLPKA